MKKNILLLTFLFCGVAFSSCGEDELSSNSIFDDEITTERTELDYWLDENYLYPYNVDFKYRMEDIESSLGNNLVPIRYDMAVQMARVVKYFSCLGLLAMES